MASPQGFPMVLAAPLQGAVAVANNTSVAAGNAIAITATGAGTVTVTLLDGSTMVLMVEANKTYRDSLAVTKFVTGTATGPTYYNLT